MKIAFWSNITGRSGVTSNLACISIMSALQYRQKSIIFENHYNINNVSNILNNYRNSIRVREEDYYFNHVGMDHLMKRIHSNIKDEHMIEKACTGYLNNKIYYIPHSENISKDIFEYELSQVLKPLLTKTEQFCDVIFIDTVSNNNLTSKIILEEADLVVVNLCQDSRLINHFFENYSSLLSKACFLIGNYNSNSKYNRKNIQRKYHIQNENIAVIPYNIELKDSLSDGSLIEFLSRNYHCKQEDDNYELIHELKKATTMIAGKILVDPVEVLIC